ncbi:MAG: septum formation initiator family protein [Dysgonamonadaceae bacterium]|jgi:cell division protein FtsB|nr:septum formation initiator family protein [Dysgonamonadaceae bacterium]
MKNWLEIFNKINKYWLAAIIFFIITFVIGDSTLKKRIDYNNEITRLKKEIEYYTKQKEETLQKLDALNSDNENLEKLAREQYQMKKSNEDLYIIVE